MKTEAYGIATNPCKELRPLKLSDQPGAQDLLRRKSFSDEMVWSIDRLLPGKRKRYFPSHRCPRISGNTAHR